jgi:hypothetical protein
MNKKLVIRGIVLGIAAPIFVALLFVTGFALYMNIGLEESFKQLRWKGQLPNVLRIGLLANLILFVFLVRNKEVVARGIMLATLFILIITLVI